MNQITSLLGIRYPIIQAGMIWCSGWKLASAVSNAGGLGLLGAGSMDATLLRDEIRRCGAATSFPFGVNIPLLYPDNPEKFDVLEAEGVRIVFTSAGNPATFTPELKRRGFTVVHIVSNVKFALKCQECGVDAIVTEGFEAGGHNGREETTTLVLIPQIHRAVTIPLIAAGGIATGRAMLAAFALGAEGVQIGSRFVATPESSAHPRFKQRILEAGDGETMVVLKKVVPVRLLKNRFFSEITAMETAGATAGELNAHLGKGRARRGMLEGEVEDGELEIGQVSGLIRQLTPAGEVVSEILREFQEANKQLSTISF